jgi:hypothetical protein
MSAAKTKPKKAKGDSKPKQNPNDINQLALKAQALATKHQATIGTRLSVAFLASFAADLTGLVNAVPAVLTSHAGKVQLTAAQGTALVAGYKLVKGVRTTVKAHDATKEVLLAYGVGTPTNKNLVGEVSAAIQTIIARVAAQPAEATSFDITADDVTALQAALTAIKDADTAQEAARASTPLTTAQRNATARRLLAGIKKIAGAGMRAFVSDATIYANFEGLVTKAAG